MKSTATPKQRRALYWRLYKDLVRFRKRYMRDFLPPSYWLCWHLSDTKYGTTTAYEVMHFSGRDMGGKAYKQFTKDWPEMAMLKPSLVGFGKPWWSRCSHEQACDERLTALAMCITLTKDKP